MHVYVITRYIITVLEVKAFGIHSLYPDFRVFDSLMIRSVPLSLTIGTSKQSSIIVFNILINFYTDQILFLSISVPI